jgi:hypothetical protein
MSPASQTCSALVHSFRGFRVQAKSNPPLPILSRQASLTFSRHDGEIGFDTRCFVAPGTLRGTCLLLLAFQRFRSSLRLRYESTGCNGIREYWRKRWQYFQGPSGLIQSGSSVDASRDGLAVRPARSFNLAFINRFPLPASNRGQLSFILGDRDGSKVKQRFQERAWMLSLPRPAPS